MRIFILLIIFFFAFSLTCLAQEKESLVDRAIASTFKGLARAYITTTDVNKLKKDSIDKLDKMDEKKFSKRYAEVYEVIKELPIKLKSRYGVTEAMTKEQAIHNINSLDKKKIYEGIDAIPDTFIVKQFRQYLDKEKQLVQGNNVLDQINKLWNTMMKKVGIS